MLSTKFTYRFTQVMIGITFIVCLLNSLIITAYVIHPFRPIIRLSGNTTTGFFDYWKGIPFKARTATAMPDSSFRLKLQWANGATGSTQFSKFYHDESPARNLNESGNGNAVVATGDTITTSFQTTELKADPSIKAAAITEITFYLWTENAGQRLWYFLPQLLTWLLISFCTWQLFILQSEIVKNQSSILKTCRRMANIGSGIVSLEATLFVMSFFPPFGKVINVKFNATLPNNFIPFDLSAYPTSPFDLQWLAFGCIMLLLAKALANNYYMNRERSTT